MRNGLIRLARLSEGQWRREEGRGDIKRLLDERGFLLKEGHVKHYMPEEEDTIELPPEDTRKVFLLPPLQHKRNLAACISIRWDFSKQYDRGWIRVFFIFEAEAEPPLVPFVVRYEDKEEGDWAFAHAQVSSDIVRPYSQIMTACDEPSPPLPTEIPRLPLAGIDREITSLFVVVLASIYGTNNRVFSKVCDKLRGDGDCNQLMRQLRGDDG